MLERRKSHIKRGCSASIMLSAASALVLVLIEILFVLFFANAKLNASEFLGFASLVLGLTLGAAVIFGVIEGVVICLATSIAERVAKQRLAEPGWIAKIGTLLIAPFIAFFVSAAFKGRYASTMPYKHVWAIAMGVFLLVSVYWFIRSIVFVRDRFRIRRWEKNQALLISAGLFILAIVFYTLDQRLFKNLYPFFHITLAIIYFILVQLAIASIYAVYRPLHRALGRILDPSTAMIVLVVGISAAAIAFATIGKSRMQRYICYEHTAIENKIVSLGRRFGLVRTGKSSSHLAKPDLKQNATNDKLRATSQPSDVPKIKGPKLENASLLLISVDALRPDHMMSYGYKKNVTPNIHRWAKNAVIFNRAYCAVPHTSFAMASLLTGKRMVAAQGEDHDTLAGLLKQSGYKTAGFYPPSVFFIEGERFSQFRKRNFDFEYIKYEYLSAEKRLVQINDYLSNHVKDEQKVFMWVHFFEPHEPYDKHHGFDFGDDTLGRYDSEIAYTDAQIAKLLEIFLKRRPNTIVVFTADHGESFGEHGARYHGNALYQEQIHIPLMIAYPKSKKRTIDFVTEHVDLFPTLLRALGISYSKPMRGKDLGPYLEGASIKKESYALVDLKEKKALVGKRYKLIVDRLREYSALYDLKNDPEETTNIAGRSDEILERLERELARKLKVHLKKENKELTLKEVFRRAEGGDFGVSNELIKIAKRDPKMQSKALNALVRMRSFNARSFAFFKEIMKSDDKKLARRGTIAAAMMGDVNALRKVKTLLGRQIEMAERKDIVLALASWKKDRAMIGDLVNFLNTTKNIKERNEIVEAFGLLGDKRGIESVISELDEFKVKESAIIALGRMGSSRGSIRELIKIAKSDSFITHRERAIDALGNLQAKAAIPLFKKILSAEKDKRLLAAVALALSRTTPKAPAGYHYFRCKAADCIAHNLECKGRSFYLNKSVGCELNIKCGEESLAKVGRKEDAIYIPDIKTEGKLSFDANSCSKEIDFVLSP